MPSFFIRSSTIRLGILISTIIIATIIVFQLLWLKKVYRFEQKEFDRSVVKVIRGLYEDLEISDYSSAHLNELIEKPEPHVYLVHITLPLNNDTLTSYLQYELEDFGVFTNCQIGTYNSKVNKYIYTTLLTSAGTKERTKTGLPVYIKSFDYVVLYFPNRQQYIISQMNFWIVSTVLLLLVLLLFSAGLYYFYCQKFLNETQKDFIHNFAHEFKTPVSIISLAADVLKDKNIIEKPDKLAIYAGIVEYQSHYLHSQIDKLLQFAYTESQKLWLKKETVNIHQLLRDAVINLEPLIGERKAVLQYELNATNPVLQADKNYILIVITNLLDNAIKYAKEPRILIATKNRNTSLIFSVTDNGIGIDEKEIKKLFKKFYRIRSEDTYTTKGFGLGLTFVKTILDAHRGKIKIESVPGRGSSFIVELPS
jgi:two-component system phosphate regulon sensor histidine kinase PhoR